MVPVNFNQLYYFWVVAKSGSISAAAERLLLDQSTVSLQMKQLETALGRRLLARSRRGTALTEDGAAAFEHCEAIFTRAQEFLASMKEAGAPAGRAFRLGVSQTVSRGRILDVVRWLKRLEPAVPVAIESRSSEELETRLKRRDVDLVVSDIDLSVRLGKDFKSRLASERRLSFAATPGIRDRMGEFPSGLGRIPLLLRARENPVRKEVDHFLHRRGVVPLVRAEIENPDLIRIMAVEGEGAAVVDPEEVGDLLRARRLVLLHSKPVDVRERVWIVAGRGGPDSPRRRAAEALLGGFRFGR